LSEALHIGPETGT